MFEAAFTFEPRLADLERQASGAPAKKTSLGDEDQIQHTLGHIATFSGPDHSTTVHLSSATVHRKSNRGASDEKVDYCGPSRGRSCVVCGRQCRAIQPITAGAESKRRASSHGL